MPGLSKTAGRRLASDTDDAPRRCGIGRRFRRGREQPVMVELVDPLRRSVTDGFEATPRSAHMNRFDLVEAVIGSAGASFWLSPTLPTGGSVPASARRSSYLTDTSALPRSERGDRL